MGRDYMDIGSAPANEDCAQVGADDYYEKVRPECTRFINLIREKLGEEPEGAFLAIKSNPHDFGSYYSVVCHYDDDNEVATKYAFRCEAEAPTEWGEDPAPGDVVNPDGSSTEYLGLTIYPGSTSTKKTAYCNFCPGDVPAVVDGMTKRGPWADMCETHFKELGIGLGTGYGQKLVDREDPPEKPGPMTVGAVLQSKSRPKELCGSCMEAAEEAGAPDDTESMNLVMAEMGDHVPDHNCDDYQTGGCLCACGKRFRRPQI